MNLSATARIYACWILCAAHLIAGLLGLAPSGRISFVILVVSLVIINLTLWKIFFINLPELHNGHQEVIGKVARSAVIISMSFTFLGIFLLLASTRFDPRSIIIYFFLSHSYAWAGFFIYTTSEWKAIKN